jgi:hypothetical protein
MLKAIHLLNLLDMSKQYNSEVPEPKNLCFFILHFQRRQIGQMNSVHNLVLINSLMRS